MRNAYQEVTDRIIAMLEAGTPPWRKQWTDGAPAASLARPLRSNGMPYAGANVLNLWAAAQMRGFRSRYWMTFKTALELNAHVRKGARGEFAFYVGKKTLEATDTTDEKTISFLKTYFVFNADEIDGLPPHYYAETAPAPAPVVGRLEAVDNFVSHLGVPIAHGGNRAFYSPSADRVQMPTFEQFEEPAAYYSTLLHEMTHATGHTSRCDRMDKWGKRFGDSGYAAEELVAELGAAFLCSDLGISNEPREDHASYLAGWISVLKADNRAIFTAAGAAEKACSWMHERQPQEEMDLAA